MEETDQLRSGKRMDVFCVRIAFQSLKETAHMILRTACPVFEAQTVLYGNDNLSAGSQMAFHQLKHIDKGILIVRIAGRILEDTDESDVIILFRQCLFHFFKSSQKDRHMITVLIPVSIDEASLSGKFHAGHAPCFLRQCPGDGAAAGSDLQNFILLCDGQPAHNVPTDMRKMVHHRPAFSLRDDLIILFRRLTAFRNLQKFLFHRSVTVQVAA